jgi:tripartite-type tricarboxylate transporter receptor subunit TctC
MTLGTISRRHLLKTAAAVTLASAATLGGSAIAQDNYPSKKIQMLLPFGAGGGQDEFARRFLPKLNPEISSQIYVDNRPGGNGILATEMATKAKPDGYTLIQQTSSFTTNPFLSKSLKFDTLKDLEPISLVARTPHVLIVRKDFPANTIEEFVAYAKSQPGKLNYGSGGIGSTNHVAALLMEKAAGIRMEHIVYKSATEYNNDLLGGRIDLVFAGAGQGAALANAGSVKAIGVTDEKRLALLPNTPTFKEAKLPDVTIYSWTGYLAPAGTPKPIIEKLAAAMQKAAKDPEVQKAFPAHELIGTTPEEFKTFIAQEYATMGELLKNVQQQ